MPVWPKRILSLGASLLTARMALRLRSRDRGVRAQRAAFRRLVRSLAATSFWRADGLEAGMTYEAFQTRVPPRPPAAFAEPIARMQAGAADLLWPGTCAFFARSSGTDEGCARVVPVTAEMLRHFSAGCRDAMLFYTARAGHAGVFRGRHLFLTGSTAMQRLATDHGHEAWVGEWPAIAALNLTPSLERHVYEPGLAVSAMEEWKPKVEAVLAQTLQRDVTLISGMPPWVLSFAETVRDRRAGAGEPIHSLSDLWPNLEVFVHGGIPLAPYANELRTALGAAVTTHEIYLATEGFFAAQDGDTPGELRLMTGLGVFFEFVPLEDWVGDRVDEMGRRAVPLEGVSPGRDYVVLLTTPAGLARYALADVVRFTSIQPPRLQVVGRATLQLNAFGEGVLERDVTEALLVVCQRHRWSIVNFHVAPLRPPVLVGQGRARHEWWVELRPGTIETPTGPQMAIELDAELQRAHPTYASLRSSGRMEPPTVRLVMPGVFRHWLEFHDRWGGQNKVPRCRSDRLIADDLAQITRFARDQM